MNHNCQVQHLRTYKLLQFHQKTIRSWRWRHLGESFCDKKVIFSRLQHHFTCLLFADAIAEAVWVSETWERHWKVCLFKGTEQCLEIIVQVSLNFFSHLYQYETRDHRKVWTGNQLRSHLTHAFRGNGTMPSIQSQHSLPVSQSNF